MQIWMWKCFCGSRSSVAALHMLRRYSNLKESAVREKCFRNIEQELMCNRAIHFPVSHNFFFAELWKHVRSFTLLQRSNLFESYTWYSNSIIHIPRDWLHTKTMARRLAESQVYFPMQTITCYCCVVTTNPLFPVFPVLESYEILTNTKSNSVSHNQPTARLLYKNNPVNTKGRNSESGTPCVHWCFLFTNAYLSNAINSKLHISIA